MEKGNNKGLYLGLAIAGTGIVLALASGKKPEKIGSGTFDDTAPSNTGVVPPVQSPPIVLNGNLLLKAGVKGEEVKKLQRLLGVNPDGIFGTTETETALVKLKGVKQTTLNQFASLPNVNQNPIAPGVRVMAASKDGCKVYGAIAKADGTYYSSEEVEKTVAYGQEVGKIKSANTTKTWYSVYYTSWGITYVGFVRSVDVVKI